MNLNHKKRKILWGQVGLHTFFILLCVCYVYPLLLLICVILLIRVWSLRRKLNKQIDTLREYEEMLQKAGLLRNGELVKGPNG